MWLHCLLRLIDDSALRIRNCRPWGVSHQNRKPLARYCLIPQGAQYHARAWNLDVSNPWPEVAKTLTRVEWREDKGGFGMVLAWEGPSGTQHRLEAYANINFPECETMSQKHLPGGPRTNRNHADRLM